MQQDPKNNRNRCTQSLASRLSFLFFLVSLLPVFLMQHVYAAPQPVVALTEIVEHPSLAEAKRGILDELKAHGYDAGKNIKIIEENAQGNIASASLIAKKFAAMKPDAIVTISTPSTQAVISAVKGMQIPVVFASVTDPVAAGIVTSLTEPHPNITGAIDFPPLTEEIVLIKQLIPHLKVLGILYNPGESNSVKTVNMLKEKIGNTFEIRTFTVNNSNQVGQAFLSIVGKVDALYVPSDNVIFSALPTLVKLSRLHGLPVFSSDPDSVKNGLLACVGYTQYAVGRTAGKLLVKVIKGERLLTIEKPKQFDTVINQTTAESIHLSLPQNINAQRVQ